MWPNLQKPGTSRKYWFCVWVNYNSSPLLLQERQLVWHSFELQTYAIWIREVGKFQGVEFLRKGNLQRFHGLISQMAAFQNCSAHNTWLTPPLTACARQLKNSGVGILPGLYATFLQNVLLSIKVYRCSHYILSSMFSYLKSKISLLHYMAPLSSLR